jgi:hypothetical protein
MAGIKLTYEQLFLQLEALWNLSLPQEDIEEHCQLMSNLVLSSGWTIEDFNRRMVCGIKKDN